MTKWLTPCKLEDVSRISSFIAINFDFFPTKSLKVSRFGALSSMLCELGLVFDQALSSLGLCCFMFYWGVHDGLPQVFLVSHRVHPRKTP